MAAPGGTVVGADVFALGVDSVAAADNVEA